MIKALVGYPDLLARSVTKCQASPGGLVTEVQMIGVVVDGRAANRKEGRLMESFATSLIKTTKVKTLYGLKGVPTRSTDVLR